MGITEGPVYRAFLPFSFFAFFFGVNGFGGVLNAFPIPRMKRSSAPGSSLISDFLGFDMTDDFVSFTDLPKSLRARALIGTYLQKWSFMEYDLNDAITAALGLKPLQGLIVCKNIQLRDKIHILKSAITLDDINKKHQPEIEALNEIKNISMSERNMVAHETFVSDNEGDGVKFLVMRAKGKLTFPQTKWSIADFLDKFENLERLGQTLQSIAERFTKKTPDLATLLRAPTNALFSLGYLDPQFHPPPDNPGLGLLTPIPQKDGETS